VLQHPAQNGPRLDVDQRQQVGHPTAPVDPNVLDAVGRRGRLPYARMVAVVGAP
jgi:hypothetical protein